MIKKLVETFVSFQDVHLKTKNEDIEVSNIEEFFFQNILNKICCLRRGGEQDQLNYIGQI